MESLSLDLFLVGQRCLSQLGMKEEGYPWSVNADAALVTNVCSKTLEPDFCNKCMNSDPTSTTVDLRGLGGISVSCASKQAELTQGFIKLYAGSALDKKLKDACVDCVPKFDSIKESLKYASQLWEQGNYADSGNQGSVSKRLYRECVTQFPNMELPGQFITALVILQAYCDTIIGIMPQIS